MEIYVLLNYSYLLFSNEHFFLQKMVYCYRLNKSIVCKVVKNGATKQQNAAHTDN